MERYPVRRKITIVKEYYEYGKISGDDFEDARIKNKEYFFSDKTEQVSDTYSTGEFELLENEFVGYSQEEIDNILKDRDMYSKINKIIEEFGLSGYKEEDRPKIKSIFLEKYNRDICICHAEGCDSWGYLDEMIEYECIRFAHRDCLDYCPDCGELGEKCMIESNGMCSNCF